MGVVDAVQVLNSFTGAVITIAIKRSTKELAYIRGLISMYDIKDVGAHIFITFSRSIRMGIMAIIYKTE